MIADSIARLIGNLHDTRAYVRQEAVLQLRLTGQREDTEQAVLDAVGKPDNVSSEAIMLLGQIGSTKAIPFLTERFLNCHGNASWDARRAVDEIIKRTEDADALNAIHSYLDGAMQQRDARKTDAEKTVIVECIMAGVANKIDMLSGETVRLTVARVAEARMARISMIADGAGRGIEAIRAVKCRGIRQ